MPLLEVHPEKVLEIPFALFTSSIVQITLKNVSSHPFVAYKIKTTAPKSYLVRPSTGAVPQGESRSVQIVLQAPTEEPPKAAADRFLIQATAAASGEALPRNYWLELPKQQLEETRLSVSFKRAAAAAADAAAAAAAAAAGAAAGDAAGRAEAPAGGGGAPSSSSSSSAAAAAAAAAAADLRQQYDQLVEYTLAMERHKEDLTKENELLRQQLEKKSSSSSSSSSYKDIWYVPIYLFVAVMLWYLLERVFRG
ncbi:major sperm protein domain-containing protein, putative [Eimeria necatrix]|uniref:Major sperm protein domain-containing protein, putative n=1 Tax=Eimeria necatrix TaxID=51315 RepID=U6N859_9EIME|nr:major sperm protein domain-containing protein, putative [Eimeria necatrix]CDJ70036.1 major sperm protein domain-containing protein, putative [Eimeria necatrix]